MDNRLPQLCGFNCKLLRSYLKRKKVCLVLLAYTDLGMLMCLGILFIVNNAVRGYLTLIVSPHLCVDKRTRSFTRRQ